MQASRLIPATSPAILLAGATILSVVTACLHSLLASLAALFCSLLLLALAKPAKILQPLLTVNLFILFMWLVVPWTTPGEILWQWRWLRITYEGVLLCSLLTLKANAILFVFLALVAPMPLPQLSAGLARLHMPKKLVLLLMLMERNIYLLKRQWQVLTEAASLAAFVPATNLRSYSALGAMLAMLFVSASDRGKKLHEAMLLAGFTGELPFRETGPLLTAKACLFLLPVVLACGLLVCLDYV